jgi:hypothetical protein
MSLYLEEEFEEKSRYLLSNDNVELTELYAEEFVDTIFERTLSG